MSYREHGAGYQVRVYSGTDPDGKATYIYRSVRTLKEAKSLERRLATEIEQGRHRGGKHTFGELLDGWWDLKSPDLALNTQRSYQNYMRTVIRPELGDVDLAKLTTRVLDRFYARLRERYATRSVRQVHAVVRGACKLGVTWAWLVTNPAVEASPGSLANLTAKMAPPEPADARRFLLALSTEDPDLAMFLRLAATVGPRRGELCGFRWSDADLELGSIAIARSLVPLKNGEVAVKTVKHGPAHRVALDARTTSMLVTFRDAAQARDRALGEWDPNGWMFTVDDAKPWHPDHATGRYRRAAKRHGIKARLHDWRHYAATHMLDAGIPAKTVAGRLGHANPSVTLSVYAHAIPATDRRAADALAATLDA